MEKIEYVIIKENTELGTLGKRGLWLYELGDVIIDKQNLRTWHESIEIDKFDTKEKALEELDKYNSRVWITYGNGNTKIVNAEEYAVEKYTYLEDDETFDGEILQLAPLDEASEELVKELRQGL